MVSIAIMLTKGRVAIVDVDDWEKVSQYSWQFNGKHARGRVNGRHTYMHRLIMNAPDGVEVDHINRNKLDNRKANLRFATDSQQKMNSKKRGNSVSRYKGVCWNSNRWVAQISLANQYYHLGRYVHEEDAAIAYDEAAKQLFGEYANLNFP